MAINPTNVVTLLDKHYSRLHLPRTDISIEERALSSEIIDYISTEGGVLVIDPLCREEEDVFFFDSEEEFDFEDKPQDKSKKSADVSEELLEKALIYYRSAGQGHRKWESMNKTHRWVKGENDIRKLLRLVPLIYLI